jgi:Tol biopolymer transport system component
VQLARSCFAVLAAAVGLPAAGQVTQAVSVDSHGAPGHGRSAWCSISPDGRFVAFRSGASDLVPGDTNGVADVFFRDRLGGTTERVSVATDGTQGNGPTGDFTSISEDGRFVGFDTYASNLVPGDVNGVADVFVHDRLTGTTECISVAAGGTPGPGEGLAPALSGDGRFVAFYSDSWNLVPGDTNGWGDVFVRDRLNGTTERVSISSTGAQGNAASGHHGPSITPDGRFVTFSSRATSLAAGTPNHDRDIFVRDRRFDTTERASLSSSGAQDNDESSAPTLSDDGRFVAFMSDATNLVARDTNGTTDVFVRDRQTDTTVRASVDSSGLEADGPSTFPAVSGDGRFVAFQSRATNLVPLDTNGAEDVLVRDLVAGTTERVSVHSNGTQGDAGSRYAAVSRTGRYVAYESFSENLVPGVVAGAHVYVHDREGDPSFTSACDPGSGGVIACPCANPPSGAGRGCDNSAATGGATLAASGGTYLSSDSLVFQVNGATPTGTSVLVQGTTQPAVGLAYGQGVRCVGGTLKRLFAKAASGGSLTVPDFAAGDPSVSARSAAKGSVIGPGEIRTYLVFYRDPIVLGGCAATSTFNATQTGLVTWSP